MRGHMRSQQLPLINIIAIRFGPTGMIRRNQQIIEILGHRNDRMLIVEHTELRIAFRVDESLVEIINNLLSHNRNGMMLLQEDVASDVGVNLGRDIRPGIGVEGFLGDLQGFRVGFALLDDGFRSCTEQTAAMLGMESH